MTFIFWGWHHFVFQCYVHNVSPLVLGETFVHDILLTFIPLVSSSTCIFTNRYCYFLRSLILSMCRCSHSRTFFLMPATTICCRKYPWVQPWHCPAPDIPSPIIVPCCGTKWGQQLWNMPVVGLGQRQLTSSAAPWQSYWGGKKCAWQWCCRSGSPWLPFGTLIIVVEAAKWKIEQHWLDQEQRCPNMCALKIDLLLVEVSSCHDSLFLP